jgi:hypothetical protein
MTQNSKDLKKNRRKALKSIIAGSGAVVAGAHVPSSWRQPIVESVVLPAHAQTSPGTETVYSGSGLIQQTSVETDDGDFLARLVNEIVPSAHAQAGGSFYACVIAGDSTAEVSIAGIGREGSDARMIRRGSLPLPPPMGSGAEGVISAQGSDTAPCEFSSADLSRPARIVSIDESTAVVEVLTRCGEELEGDCGSDTYLRLSVPRSDAGCLPEPMIRDDCPR